MTRCDPVAEAVLSMSSRPSLARLAQTRVISGVWLAWHEALLGSTAFWTSSVANCNALKARGIWPSSSSCFVLLIRTEHCDNWNPDSNIKL